jgi:hypothetical protein
MITSNTCIDGIKYSNEIINSKHNFLLSVIPTAVYIAKKENLSFSNKKLFKDNDQSKFVLLIIGQYHSIRRQITEVMKGTYLPKPMDFLDTKYGPNTVERVAKGSVYFLQRVPENLDSFEIYNDLNYGLTNREPRDFEQSMAMMQNSRAINNYIEGEFLHIDLSKTSEFEDARETIKTTELIEYIYGSVKNLVNIGKLEFTIQDLINLVDKIRCLSEDISSIRQKNKKHIPIYKQSFKNLSRQLRLTTLEKDLINLFCVDVIEDSSNDLEYFPFFMKDSYFYMMPPLQE